MKNTIMALAVLGCWISGASAQTSVTVYGIVDAALTHITNDHGVGAKTSLEPGQMQVSRWGLKGVEDLGGGMRARFGLEGTLQNDAGSAGVATGTPSSTSLFDREATAGLGSSNYGAIDFGRQANLALGTVGLADPMALAFASTNPNVLFGALNNATVYAPYGSNNGGTALRQNNAIKYSSPLLQGFGFALMRGLGEQAGDSARSSYAGASVYYNNGPFGAGASYARLKNASDTERLKSWAVGAKYAWPVAVLKSTYAENQVDVSRRKIRVIGVGLDVPVAPALTLTGAVYSTRRSGDARDDSQQYVFIARHALSKRSTLYGAVTHANTDHVVTATQINLAQGIVAVGSDSANRYTLGISHTF